jgi:hypothetical protein
MFKLECQLRAVLVHEFSEQCTAKEALQYSTRWHGPRLCLTCDCYDPIPSYKGRTGDLA